MTQGGTKRPRAKKAIASKGKKTRAKKEEVVEVLEDPPEDVQPEYQEEPPHIEAEEAAPKPARGRKRASPAVEDSVLTNAEAPAAKKRATRGRVVSAKAEKPDTDHAMFDPVPPEVDDAVIDAELNTLEAEMEDEPAQPLHVPKKGRPAGTRKASKQTTKKTKTKAPVETTPEPEPIVDPEIDELTEDHNTSTVSNGTIIRTSLSSFTAPKKRGRPSKKSLLAQAAALLAQAEAQQEPPAQPSPEPEAEVEETAMPEPEPEPAPVAPQKVTKVTKILPPSRDKSLPLPPPESDDMEPPATPKASSPPAPAARQAAVSPSQSPQSSDAENQPPSSKPSNTAKSTRVALVPVSATPVQLSPSKRNIIAGLESTNAWTAVDVEAIFDDLDKENSLSTGRFLKSGMDLTSPEKHMTVEEWIYHNAEQAEKQLKHECEAIVMSFEREGTKAMQTLEGIVVE